MTRNASAGLAAAVRENAALARDVNVAGGHLVHPAVARGFRRRAAKLAEVLPAEA